MKGTHDRLTNGINDRPWEMGRLKKGSDNMKEPTLV